MKFSITTGSVNHLCVDCGAVVRGDVRVCPRCGRVKVPPGDHHPAAATGDEAAQFYLGSQYFFGIDVPRDLAESEKWYRKSAEQGRVAAMSNLGVLCMMKKPADHAEAARWLRLAAERGDAVAQTVLESLLKGGPVVPQRGAEGERRPDTAADHSERGPAQAPAVEAEAGHTETRAGDAPVRGDGGHDALPADGEEARGSPPPTQRQAPPGGVVLRKAEPESPPPEIREGSPGDIESLRRGAQKGLSGFQLELGERYAKGVKGVPRDYAEARRWLTRAFHDPEFPEHRDQAAALLAELDSAPRAGSGRASSRGSTAARARLRSLRPWHVLATIAAVTFAVLLWGRLVP